MNEFEKVQSAKITSCYNTDENLSELQKAEILDIEKGGKRALIGEKRTFGGREYIKTSDGWKFHGKGTGTKAQEHAAGATAKTEEKPESTPKIEDLESSLKTLIEMSLSEKDPGQKANHEAKIPKKFQEYKRAGGNKTLGELAESKSAESPKAEESTSTDSHSAAEVKKKALEIMRAKGSAEVKLSDFTIRQAKQVIKEHETLGSKETPKTEKVAEEKKVTKGPKVALVHDGQPPQFFPKGEWTVKKFFRVSPGGGWAMSFRAGGQLRSDGKGKLESSIDNGKTWKKRVPPISDTTEMSFTLYGRDPDQRDMWNSIVQNIE